MHTLVCFNWRLEGKSNFMVNLNNSNDDNFFFQVVCVLRLIEGLCQGVIFPSTHTLLSKWAPVSERAQLATYCYSGSQFGTVIMLSSSGFLASSFMGWPSIFYISGSAGGLWAVLWVFFGSNSPADYKYISIEEKEFIHSSLGSSDEDKENEHQKHLKTPWGAIFTSMPFYAIVFVHSGESWSFQDKSIIRYIYFFELLSFAYSFFGGTSRYTFRMM